MNKSIFALYGVSNVGKSTVINLTYDLFIGKYSKASVLVENRGVEVFAIVEYRGTKIGFTSVGDVGEMVAENLAALIKEKCTLIVCATRTRGKTVQAVEAHCPPYQLQWVEQIVGKAANQYKRSNTNMSKKLLALIEGAIGA